MQVVRSTGGEVLWRGFTMNDVNVFSVCIKIMLAPLPPRISWKRFRLTSKRYTLRKQMPAPGEVFVLWYCLAFDIRVGLARPYSAPLRRGPEKGEPSQPS